MFIRDEWYAAAWSDEVGRALLARTFCGEPAVLFRTPDGEAVALADRCPHRFAPLSLGRLDGEHVECGYHGLRFDRTGTCVRVPGQDRIPPAARVRRYPVREQDGLVWIWPGNPEHAASREPPGIPHFGQPDWGLSRGPCTRFAAGYRIVLENLVDPAHTSFVHRRTIGSGGASEVTVEAVEDGDVVTVGRWIDDAPPVPIVRRFATFAGNVDRWQYYHLRVPNLSWVDFGSIETGRPHTEAERTRAPYRVFSYALLTPETATSTLYFWFQLRNFQPDDAALSAELVRLYTATFEEDRELLERIQLAETRAPDLRPVRIAADAGVGRLHRILERRLAAEAPA